MAEWPYSQVRTAMGRALRTSGPRDWAASTVPHFCGGYLLSLKWDKGDAETEIVIAT